MDWKWLAGGAVVTVLASAWSYVRWAAGYLASYVVITARVDSDLSECLARYLVDHGKLSPYGVKHYGAGSVSMRATGLLEWQAYERLSFGSLFWLGWVPVRLTSSDSNSSLVILRGSIRLDWLLIQATAYRGVYDRSSQSEAGRYCVRVLAGVGNRMQVSVLTKPGSSGESPEPHVNTHMYYMSPACKLIGCTLADIGYDPSSAAGLADMALNAAAESTVQLLLNWKNSREWYRSRTVPWKLGVRLVGRPGSGKTSLVRAMGIKLNLPVFVFDLATMDNAEFRDFWKDVRGASPAIVLFEDFDAVFLGRDAVPEGLQLSFDTILQSVSGLDESDGVLMFLTTNKPETLDEALTRPGRFEHELVMDSLDTAGIRKIATRILADWPELIEPAVTKLHGSVGAAVQSYCVELALEQRALVHKAEVGL